MINFELYKIFYMVAKNKSLSKTAEKLFVSQPAISQSIKQLEKLLDTPLFVRKNHGMELSAQGGKIIYDDVEKAVNLLDNIEKKLCVLKQKAVGKLRIGASETIFQYFLAEKIVEYNKMFPEIKIELISDVSPKIIELMKNDLCDIGFLNLPVQTDEDIVIKKSIYSLNDIFIAGKNFNELKGKTLNITDLQNYPLLLMEEKTVSREAINNFAKNNGVTLKPKVEINSWDFMKKLVENGMGIGCIPKEYAKNELNDGVLFEVNVYPAMQTRSVGLTLPAKANMTFALQSFINLFE